MALRRSMIRQLLLPAREFALDLVFPPRCGGCRKLGWGFCPECAAGVVPAAVTGGWEAYASQADAEIVLDWRLEELGIERLCAAGEYQGALRSALVKLKYGNGRYLAPWLGRLLAPQLVAIAGDGAALVPVPLHSKRQKQRGYNQSLLLARELARELDAEVLDGALTRSSNTPPQVGLTATQRRANVRGAFAADAAKLAGRDVVIVDDIVTTGSTVMACARACRRAGAGRLYVAAVAHG
jgi:ComF family protein